MPPSSLCHWFQPDECEVCPLCGQRAVVTPHEARYCLACGSMWLEDADGLYTLAVSSLDALPQVPRTDAAPAPDVDAAAIRGSIAGGAALREGRPRERSPA